MRLNKWIVLLFLLSLMVHVGYVVSPLAENNFRPIDAAIYLDLAENLAEQGRYCVSHDAFQTVVAGEPTLFWTPVYPVFLAALRLVHLDSHLQIALIQAVLMALSVFPVYGLLQLFLDKRPLLVATIVWVFYPFHVIMTYHIASENICMLIEWCTLFVAATLSLHYPEKRSLYLLLGLMLGVLVLTRPERLLLAAGVCIWIVGRNVVIHKIWGVRNMGILVAGMSFVVLPWLVRNYQITEGHIAFSTRLPFNLLAHNKVWELTSTRQIDSSTEYYSDHPTAGTEYQRAQQLKKDAITFIYENPVTYGLICIRRTASLLMPAFVKDYWMRKFNRRPGSKDLLPLWEVAQIVFLIAFLAITIPGWFAAHRAGALTRDFFLGVPGLLFIAAMAQLIVSILISSAPQLRLMTDTYWITLGIWGLSSSRLVSKMPTESPQGPLSAVTS
ncbi:glycosyltransferase family 39 protein [Bythopirellula goksoeyrii]|nr:glycosyltransferase family 39 protein [Bythopirellula goksoeyrii]